jgi:hypothetical protein
MCLLLVACFTHDSPHQIVDRDEGMQLLGHAVRSVIAEHVEAERLFEMKKRLIGLLIGSCILPSYIITDGEAAAINCLTILQPPRSELCLF